MLNSIKIQKNENILTFVAIILDWEFDKKFIFKHFSHSLSEV